jgi:hypothetical protein
VFWGLFWFFILSLSCKKVEEGGEKIPPSSLRRRRLFPGVVAVFEFRSPRKEKGVWFFVSLSFCFFLQVKKKLV